MALRQTLAVAVIPLLCGGAPGCSVYSVDLLAFPTDAAAGVGSELELPPPEFEPPEGGDSRAADGNSTGAEEFGRDATSSSAAPDATADVLAAESGRGDADAADASSLSDTTTRPTPDATAPEGGCASGNAVQLGGATYASITRVVQDDFTIEAWIRMTHSLNGTYFWEGSAIVWADVSTNASDFVVSVVNDKLAIGVGSPDSAAQSTSNAAAGSWVHVATTRTRSTGNMTVYVNGVAQGSATGNTSSLNASATMLIGNSSGGNNGFVGELDELRVWATVRTASEISSNMTRRLVGNESGLVSYFRFDESSGPTAIDSSPAANHGLFKGPVIWVPSTAPICK